jgi:hypothetical protein
MEFWLAPVKQVRVAMAEPLAKARLELASMVI